MWSPPCGRVLGAGQVKASKLHVQICLQRRVVEVLKYVEKIRKTKKKKKNGKTEASGEKPPPRERRGLEVEAPASWPRDLGYVFEFLF